MEITPRLQDAYKLDMAVTNEKHFTATGTAGAAQGGSYAATLGAQIGADAVLRAGEPSFADVMLRAIDNVSAGQNKAAALTEQAIVDPASVDIHDITVAEAEASMQLNIARTILSRLTQAWKDIINTR